MEFGYVLYQVHPVDADGPGPTVNLDFQATVDCQGQVILGNLAAFHQVRVGIVLVEIVLNERLKGPPSLVTFSSSESESLRRFVKLP